MHPDYLRAEAILGQVIGACIEVHREKGPGLLENIYKKCLCHELSLRGIATESEFIIPITYKDLTFKESLRLDVYVDHCLIIEAKAVEKILPIHQAQLLSYMKLLNAPVGLLVNFHEVLLRNSIRRLTLRDARAF